MPSQGRMGTCVPGSMGCEPINASVSKRAPYTSKIWHLRGTDQAVVWAGLVQNPTGSQLEPRLVRRLPEA